MDLSDMRKKYKGDEEVRIDELPHSSNLVNGYQDVNGRCKYMHIPEAQQCLASVLALFQLCINDLFCNVNYVDDCNIFIASSIQCTFNVL